MIVACIFRVMAMVALAVIPLLRMFYSKVSSFSEVRICGSTTAQETFLPHAPLQELSLLGLMPYFDVVWA